MPDNVANMIACSIVSARLDYCTSLLHGMSEVNFAKLQCVQNTKARVVTGTRSNDHFKEEVMHITPVLAKLHWLPVKARIAFKLAMQVYNIRHTSSPPHLASLLSEYKSVRNLRSSVNHLLKVNPPRLKCSETEFRHAAVAVWNTLRQTVRECGRVGTLRKHLNNNSHKST